MMARVRIIMPLLAIIFALSAPPAQAQAQVLTGDAAEIVIRNEDGARVRFQGEAIGDVMRAGKGRSWVNVLSGGTALGVWTAEKDVQAVSVLGDFHNRGDVVEVSGIYNSACDIHGGDTDVHATEFTVVSQGRRISTSPALWKLVLGLALGILGLVLRQVHAVRSRRIA